MEEAVTDSLREDEGYISGHRMVEVTANIVKDTSHINTQVGGYEEDQEIKKEARTAKGDQMESSKPNTEKEDDMNSSVLKISPLAIYDPTTDTILRLQDDNRGGSEPEDGVMTTQEEEMNGEENTKADFFVVHTEDGGRRLMHKSKWPLLVPESSAAIDEDKRDEGLVSGKKKQLQGADGLMPKEGVGEGSEKHRGARLTQDSGLEAQQTDGTTIATEVGKNKEGDGGGSKWEVQKATGGGKNKQKYQLVVAARKSARGETCCDHNEPRYGA